MQFAELSEHKTFKARPLKSCILLIQFSFSDISYDPQNVNQLSIIKSNEYNNQSRFAFDNPYYRDDENDFIGKLSNR